MAPIRKQPDTSKQQGRERERFYKARRLRRGVDLQTYSGRNLPIRLLIMTGVGVFIIIAVIPLIIGLISGGGISSIFLNISTIVIGISSAFVAVFELYEKSRESRDEK